MDSMREGATFQGDGQSGALLRYSNVAVAFHWLVVALLLAQLWLGFMFHRVLDEGPLRAEYFTWHKTVGATILVLVLVRLAYRLINPPPPYPEEMPDWRHQAAVWSHRLLYALTIVVPLTGLIAVSDRGPTTGLAGGIQLPTVPGISEATGDLSGDLHVVLVWSTIALVVLHIAAALYEQFVARCSVAYRMPPLRPRHHQPVVIGQGGAGSPPEG
jgi:cytochrome b561